MYYMMMALQLAALAIGDQASRKTGALILAGS
jgi:hypothetical protein